MSATRELILQTTCELMEQQGYHGTGLNEIVKESGAPKGSLYHYFPDGKEQIAAEAVKLTGSATAQRILTGISGSHNAAEVVHEFILNIAAHVESSEFRAGSPLTSVAMETATKSKRINLACREAYTLLETAFERRLLDLGFVEEKAKEMATFITALVEGGIILSRTYHSGNPLRIIAKNLKLFLTQLKYAD